MFSAKEVFDIAIRLEQNSERLYRKALEYVWDQPLRETLVWLADQEKRHRERFTEMKNTVKEESNDLWAEEMGAAIVRGAVQHHALSLEEVDFSTIRHEDELIAAALEFEQDGVTFYQIIRSFVTDSETLVHLDEIINEERRHIRAIEDRRQRLKELRETPRQDIK